MMAGLHVHNFSNTYLDDWLALRAVSETKTLFQLFSVIHTYRMRKFLTSFFAGVCIVTIIIIIPNDVEAYSHGLLISGCNYHKHCMLAYRIIIINYVKHVNVVLVKNYHFTNTFTLPL